MSNSNLASNPFVKNKTLLGKMKADFSKNNVYYIMLIPLILYYIIFHYFPMYGAQIAFKNFSIGKGIIKSPWVGLKHFNSFFSSIYFGRLLTNTLLLNIYDIIFGFPLPIVLALMLNEVRSSKYRRTIQTVTYLPHFISIVVLCSMVRDFTARTGMINEIIVLFGGEPIIFLQEADWYRTVFVSSGIWREFGWSSIIYMASLSAIDVEMYEAAHIDGASRLKQIWYITLPSLLPTIVIMLIIRFGRIMNVGVEKTLLLYNPSTYKTADVISSYVYRKGIIDGNYSFSSAVGLFNSVINFALLLTVNRISKSLTGSGLF
ncbi:MAG: ABC transporter permease [Christensenellales bacterium]|jgi:putative aldouronate transport system permease protein